MDVLIIGGLGQVGSYLTEGLSKDRYNRVTELDNLSSNIKKIGAINGVTFADGNILDKEPVDKLVSKSDVIIHTAAQISVGNSTEDPVHDAEVNISGTLNLLDAARKSKIRRGWSLLWKRLDRENEWYKADVLLKNEELIFKMWPYCFYLYMLKTKLKIGNCARST